MDCRTTSTKTRRAGFTLVELLVGMAVAAVVIAAVLAFSSYSGRSLAAISNYADMDSYSRNALDIMTKEIRKTKSLKSYSATQLTFVDCDGLELRYSYDPNAHTLTRVKAGESKVLLKQCDSLNFSIFQRNPIRGNYDVYPTGTPSTCKVVQLSWACSRKILGAKVNTENAISTKVVIRNE